MDLQAPGLSPTKNHLSLWWKQIRNNPKSMSSDSLPVNDIKPSRPALMQHSRSFNHSRRPASPPSDPNSEEYRSYRDSFLSSQHQFMGQVFGVPLSESLKVASAEVIVQSELVSFGRIPILVAKCGAYLKSQGLKTSGIFRIAGNSKRVKELQYIFSSPPSYGTKLSDWDGYTVHDAASVLRRYLNNLEEPLVPLSLYEQFRMPLQSRPRILKHLANASQREKNDQSDQEKPKKEEVDAEEAQRLKMKAVRHKKRLTRDIKAALKEYESLFSILSGDARQLLIYLLDLLSLFAQQSDVNLMTARNLAAIFQPSIMSHPQHDMDPKQYELSRYVVEFLIEYSYKLLPHLLKNSKTARDTANETPKLKQPTYEKDREVTIPQTVVSPDPGTPNEEEAVLLSPVTPTSPRHNLESQSRLTPPSPSFLEKQNHIPRGRPHSKSMSYTLNPSDVISGRRNSRFPWLNRALSNDTGDTGTEEDCEEEEEEDINSPSSIHSGSVPKQNFLSLPKPRIRSMSGNSTTSGGMRPLSQIMNQSIEELTSSLGIRRNSGTEGSQPGTDEETEHHSRSRSTRRNSWFQRLRSQSRSATRT